MSLRLLYLSEEVHRYGLTCGASCCRLSASRVVAGRPAESARTVSALSARRGNRPVRGCRLAVKPLHLLRFGRDCLPRDEFGTVAEFSNGCFECSSRHVVQLSTHRSPLRQR